jgi:hypothetical protein
MKIIIAAMALLLTACHAQPSNQPKDTAAYKPGKHHFKFTEHGMYYNGVQFHLGDTIQTYVKIFGPYSRDLGGGAYAWDSLGMMVAAPPPYTPRIAVIRWQVSYRADYFEDNNANKRYSDFPKYLIPEPLEIENCGVLITPNMRLRLLLNKTDCFYEHLYTYKNTGVTDTSANAFLHHLTFYLDKEIYDEAENKRPYAVVATFSVDAEDELSIYKN